MLDLTIVMNKPVLALVDKMFLIRLQKSDFEQQNTKAAIEQYELIEVSKKCNIRTDHS